MMRSRQVRGSVLHVRGPVLSAVLHGAALATLLLAAAKAPRIERVRLPGSANGKHLLLTYTVGGQVSPAPGTVEKRTAKATSKSALAQKAAPAPVAPAKPMAEEGTGSAGLTALGSGNVKIAAVKVFPRPQPDLSSLQPGHGGNVILDATIDNHGTITDLKVVSGLNDAIDQQVLAAVRGWSFEPATRDGQPIASEQQIVLHYERG